MSWSDRFLDQYILIETTDFCNLNCIMCSHENIPGPHSKPKGFMSLELFKKIVDEIPEKRVAAGYKLFWLGEPLLNPDFSKMLEYLWNKLKNRPEYIDIHTNAHFLNEEMIDLLLKIGDKLPRLTISMDAVNDDTYKKIRRGGDLKKVKKNLIRFLEEREKRGLTHPTLIFQFIIMNENKDEALEFQEFWINTIKDIKKKYSKNIFSKLSKKLFNDGLKDVIWFKRLDVSPEKREWAENIYINTAKRFKLRKIETNEYDVIVSIDNLWDSEEGEKRATDDKVANQECEERQITKKSFRPVCSAIFKSPCFMWNGDLTICCFDPAMQYSLGNIKQKSFEELWQGDKMEEIRLKQIQGDFDSILTTDGYSKCSSCSGYDTPRITDEEIYEYLSERNKLDIWKEYIKRKDE